MKDKHVITIQLSRIRGDSNWEAELSVEHMDPREDVPKERVDSSWASFGHVVDDVHIMLNQLRDSGGYTEEISSLPGREIEVKYPTPTIHVVDLDGFASSMVKTLTENPHLVDVRSVNDAQVVDAQGLRGGDMSNGNSFPQLGDTVGLPFARATVENILIDGRVELDFGAVDRGYLKLEVVDGKSTGKFTFICPGDTTRGCVLVPVADGAWELRVPKTTEAKPAVQDTNWGQMQFFAYAHLPPHLQQVSSAFCSLADWMFRNLPENPEKEVALRKLLEAKDAAVRAKIYKEAPDEPTI